MTNPNILQKPHIARIEYAFNVGKKHRKNGVGYSNIFQDKWQKIAYVKGYASIFSNLNG